MENDIEVKKEFTHKVVDELNYCVFYGSFLDCENYIELNKNKEKELKIINLYNILK